MHEVMLNHKNSFGLFDTYADANCIVVALRKRAPLQNFTIRTIDYANSMCILSGYPESAIGKNVKEIIHGYPFELQLITDSEDMGVAITPEVEVSNTNHMFNCNMLNVKPYSLDDTKKVYHGFIWALNREDAISEFTKSIAAMYSELLASYIPAVVPKPINLFSTRK